MGKGKGNKNESKKGEKRKILSRNRMWPAQSKILTPSPLLKKFATPILNSMYTVWIQIDVCVIYHSHTIYNTYVC